MNLRRRYNLIWCLLVGIDNRYYNDETRHTQDILSDLKSLDWKFTDEEIRNIIAQLKEYMFLTASGWELTREGVELLKQIQTDNDLYFNPNFEDGHVVWVDLLHYLTDTKTEVSKSMLNEIQEKVIEVIEKYRRSGYSVLLH